VKWSIGQPVCCVIVAMLVPTLGLARQQPHAVCSDEVDTATGLYVGRVANDVTISVLGKNMHFALYQRVALDPVVKGERVVAAYQKSSQGGIPILCILRRFPELDLGPQGQEGKNEPLGVAELSIPASKWESIKSEIRLNRGAQPDIHTYGAYSSGPYSRSSGATSPGNQTSHQEAEGTVTEIKIFSPYEYELELKPLRTQDIKAVQGGFFVDLSTSIEARLQEGVPVNVEFRLGEDSKKIAIALHEIRTPQ
jgi:hypothetical protein